MAFPLFSIGDRVKLRYCGPENEGVVVSASIRELSDPSQYFWQIWDKLPCGPSRFIYVIDFDKPVPIVRRSEFKGDDWAYEKVQCHRYQLNPEGNLERVA